MPRKTKTTPRRPRKNEGSSNRHRSVDVPVMRVEEWDIRKYGAQFDPYVEYAKQDQYFTIKLHHGGKIVDAKYVNGTVSYVDFCRVNEFNLCDLSAVMVGLGYAKTTITAFYYVEPNVRTLAAMHPLLEESHMKSFLEGLKGSKVAEVFSTNLTVEEAKEQLVADQIKVFKEFIEKEYSCVRVSETEFMKKGNKVVIEEIVEDKEATIVTPNKRKRKSTPLLLTWKDDPKDKWEIEDDSEFIELLNSIETQTLLEETLFCSPDGGNSVGTSNVSGILEELADLRGDDEDPTMDEIGQNSFGLGVADSTKNVGCAVGAESANIEVAAGSTDNVVEGAEEEPLTVVDGDPEQSTHVVEGLDEETTNVANAACEETTNHADGACCGTGGWVDEVIVEDVAEDDSDYDIGDKAPHQENNEPKTNEAVPELVTEPDSMENQRHYEEGLLDDFDEFETDPTLLVNRLCRDEQLFEEYLQSVMSRDEEMTNLDADAAPRAETTEPPDEDNTNVEGTSSGLCPDPSLQSDPNRKRPRYVYHKSKQVNPGDLLEDNVNVGLHSNPNSDEEGNGQRRVLYPAFMRSLTVPKWHVGDKFGSREKFVAALQDYSILTGRPTYLYTNDGTRLRAKCKKPCQWYVYARKIKATGSPDYVICAMKDTHVNCTPTWENKRITAKWLGERYLEKVRANPKMPIAAIRQNVDQDFHTEISRSKAYRARIIALEGIYGKTVEQYRRLFDYRAELLRTHPSSTVEIHYENFREDGRNPRFLRIYCCLGPLKRGFIRHCRPFICLDGCFLRGMYKGQLLTAIATDQNNGWWPIAWAVVEKEAHEQWKWFLDLLVGDLNMEGTSHFTFMSDKQKGIGLALAELLPNCEHRFCVQHIYNNVKKKFPGQVMKDHLWGIASSTTSQMFEQRMEALKVLHDSAFRYVERVGKKESWVKAFFSALTKCDTLVNNMCETFNAKIVEAREKSIITMLEEIRVFVMKRIQRRGEWMKSYPFHVPPRIKEIIDDTIAKSRPWKPVSNGSGGYQVSGPTGQFVVYPRRRTCSCRLWQLRGIPCEHAVPCIIRQGKEVHDYVSLSYTTKGMIQLYENTFFPINGMDMWPDSGMLQLDSPRSKRQRGRPKTKRFEPPEVRVSEDGTERLRRHIVINCRRCGMQGHNVRTCTNDPHESQDIGSTSKSNTSATNPSPAQEYVEDPITVEQQPLGDPGVGETQQLRRSTRLRNTNDSPSTSEPRRTRTRLDKIRINENASWLGEAPPYKVGRWKRSRAQRVGKRDNY